MRVCIDETRNCFDALIAYHVKVVNNGFILEDHYYDALFSRTLGYERAKRKARKLAREYDTKVAL